MAAEGRPFKGVLYAGLMLTDGGAEADRIQRAASAIPNARCCCRACKSDLLPALIAARDGVLKNFDLRWHDEAALCVVLAAKGYPGEPTARQRDRRARRRRRRPGRAHLPRRHARATARRILADGGRVLDVVALRRDRGRGAGAGLRGDRPHRLARRLLPPRHRRQRLTRRGLCVAAQQPRRGDAEQRR